MLQGLRRPAAQEGGRPDRVPFVPTAQDTWPHGPLSRFMGTVLGGARQEERCGAWPYTLTFQTACTQQVSRPSCGQAPRVLPPGGGVGFGDSSLKLRSQACLLCSEKQTLEPPANLPRRVPGPSRRKGASFPKALECSGICLLLSPTFPTQQWVLGARGNSHRITTPCRCLAAHLSPASLPL